MFSILQIKLHAFSILGTDPLLIAATYCLASSTSMYPFKTYPFSSFTFTLLRIFSLTILTCATNSGRRDSSLSFDKLCNCFSFANGRIIVWQSRTLKKVRRWERILFFETMLSESPFWSRRARSKYSWGVICYWFWSISWREKSLTIQMKLGKMAANALSSCWESSEDSWMFFVKFTTSESCWSAFSSIVPIEL